MDDTRVVFDAGMIKFVTLGVLCIQDYAYKISFPGRKRDSARWKRCEIVER
jgi:hypothetical protein